MSGTDIAEEVRRRVRETAGERCGYCLSPQRLVMGQLEIEHFVTHGRGGGDEESNLQLSCSLCNRYKGAQVEADDPVTGDIVLLYNPRTDNYQEHFSRSADGAKIVRLTPVERATVVAVKVNSEVAVGVRRNWVLDGWHPPNG